MKRVDFADQIRDHLAAVQAMMPLVPLLESIASRLAQCIQQGGTVYLCGNGGSAADAQHVAGEFVGRFLRERRPYPAVALTVDSSILTAVANDYGYEHVFSRQVSALARPKDVVVGISTSGKSVSILTAIAAAKVNGAGTIGFTGDRGGPLAQECDLVFPAPVSHTPRIQELHLLAWHLICDKVEETLTDA